MEHLVFVTLSLTKGGAERVICNMCNEYFADRYRVTIVSLMAAEPEYRLDKRIRLIRLDRRQEQYRQNPALRFLRRRRALRRVLRGFAGEGSAPAALVSFLPEPNFIAASLSAGFDFPVILSVRNDPVREYGSKLRRALMKRYYPRAQGYVFQTEQARAYFSFSRHITENSAVIPNPLGREFIGSRPSCCRRKEIAVVGRLEQQKEPLLLLAAFERLHRRFSDYRLVFYGEGSLKERIERESAERGLAEAVVLKGNVDRIREAVRDAALFVLSSRYEGMPNALMEAMALGVPCVATDCPCGGPAYLIRSGENGLLVPVGEEEALADAMAYVLEDSARAQKMGERAQDIIKKLDPDTIYESWERFLASRRENTREKD